MRLPKIFTAIVGVVFLLASSTVHAEPKAIDFVDGVDWIKRVITVIGEGLAPQNTVNYTQAKGMASKAAQADAYRKLSEIINGVHVEGDTTVEKMRTTHDRIQMRVAATIKGAKIINQAFLTDGSYRVIMQVPLFGSSNSLASAIFEKSSTIEPFPNPVYSVMPSTPTYNSNTPIVPINPNKPPLSRLQSNVANLVTETIVLGTSGAPIKKSVEEFANLAKGNYTGLIVDCRGMGLKPVMSPVILNTNGTKIFGHKNLDIEKIVTMGMVDYVQDENAVSRAGENPLIVKPVKLENFNSNPVLSIADSNRVLIENHATKFLKELKVVFLFD